MSPSKQSVPEGGEFATPKPRYTWTCSMCDGLRLIEDFTADEDAKLMNCPKCEVAQRSGIAFELVRRSVTREIPASEGLASPAVGAPNFVYEVWQFFVEEGTARRVAVEDDVGAAYMVQWDLEEALYGSVKDG